MGISMRSRDRVLKKRNEAVLLLYDRILAELNPNEFTQREVIEEFGALGGESDKKTACNGEAYLQRLLNELVEFGYAEELADGKMRLCEIAESPEED